MKAPRLYRTPRRTTMRGLLLTGLLLSALVLALPAAASDRLELPRGWENRRLDAAHPELWPEGGGGPLLTLLYMDVAALNAAVAGSGWDVPAFYDQPLLLWGGWGGGGVNSVRFGGLGAGAELVEETSSGRSHFSLGYGGAFLQYVFRPGAGQTTSDDEPSARGRLRFTLGGLLGGGEYQLRLTDLATHPYPTHRLAQQAFVLLMPEVGAEFSLTGVTHLRVAAAYPYLIPVTTVKEDPAIHPDPAIFRNLAVSVGLQFGLF